MTPTPAGGSMVPNKDINQKLYKCDGYSKNADIQCKYRWCFLRAVQYEYEYLHRITGFTYKVRVGNTMKIPKERAINYMDLLNHISEAGFVETPPTHVTIEVNDTLLESLYSFASKGDEEYSVFEDLIRFLNEEVLYPNLSSKYPGPLDKVYPLPLDRSKLPSEVFAKGSLVDVALRTALTNYISYKLTEHNIPTVEVFSGGSSIHIHIFPTDFPPSLEELVKKNPENKKKFKPTSKDTKVADTRWNLTGILFMSIIEEIGLRKKLFFDRVRLNAHPLIDDKVLERARVFPIGYFQRRDKPYPTRFETPLWQETLCAESKEDWRKFFWKVPAKYDAAFQKFRLYEDLSLPRDKIILFDKVTFVASEEEKIDELRKEQIASTVTKAILNHFENYGLADLSLESFKVGIPKGARDDVSGKVYLALRHRGFPIRVALMYVRRLLELSDPVGEWDVEKKQMFEKLPTHTEGNFREEALSLSQVYSLIEKEGPRAEGIPKWTLDEVYMVDRIFEAWSDFLSRISKIRVYSGMNETELDRVIVLDLPDELEVKKPESLSAPSGVFGRRFLEGKGEEEISAPPEVSEEELFQKFLKLFMEYSSSRYPSLPYLRNISRYFRDVNVWFGTKKKTKEEKARFLYKLLFSYFQGLYSSKVQTVPVEYVHVTTTIVDQFVYLYRTMVSDREDFGDMLKNILSFDKEENIYQQVCKLVDRELKDTVKKQWVVQKLHMFLEGLSRKVKRAQVNALVDYLIETKTFKKEDGSFYRETRFRPKILEQIRSKVCEALHEEVLLEWKEARKREEEKVEEIYKPKM